MAREEHMTRAQQIRSEALEQATRIAERHHQLPEEQAKLAVQLSSIFVKYIRDGE